MEAVKRRARVRHNHLEWTNASPDLPDGEVEVLLLYTKEEDVLVSRSEAIGKAKE